MKTENEEIKFQNLLILTDSKLHFKNSFQTKSFQTNLFSRQGQNIELRNRTAMPQTQIILSLYLCNLISNVNFSSFDFYKSWHLFVLDAHHSDPQILISPVVTFNFFMICLIFSFQLFKSLIKALTIPRTRDNK